MNFPLFSPALQMVLAAVVYFLLLKSWSSVASEVRRDKLLVAILIISLVIAIGVWLIVGMLFPIDTITTELIIWVWPASLGLVLLMWSVMLRRKPWWSIAALAASLVLVLILSNNQYRYYPTLTAFYEALTTTAATNTAPPKMSKGGQKTVVEQYFTPPPGQSMHGQITVLNIASHSSTFKPRQGYIYLPPAGLESSQLRLPVIVLLTGQPGAPSDWKNQGLAQLMDNFASKHKGLAPIVAVVDAYGVADRNTLCIDSPLGLVETYLTKDVPSYLQRYYQVATGPSQWVIAGLSAGGTCSNIVALRHPDVYGGFMNMSGYPDPSLGSKQKTLQVLFNGSVEREQKYSPTVILQKQPRYPYPMFAWLFVGASDDQKLKAAMAAEAMLAKQAGLDVIYRMAPGGHSFEVWRQGFVAGLPWLSYQMGLTLP